MSSKAPPGTQSVLRAVGLLKALTRSGRDMDLGELTDAVGLARTTAHRLLSALESEGLVARDAGSSAYRLGPEAIALGAQALRANDLRALVHPHLERLASDSGETATLEVPTPGGMLILDEVLGPHLMGTTPSIGTIWAMHAASTGKAYLAACSGSERARMLRGRLRPLTERTLTSRAALDADLDGVARRGYARSVGELAQGFSAVAAPILDADGLPVAAISVGGPAVRVGRGRLASLGTQVAKAAAEVTAILGHRDV